MLHARTRGAFIAAVIAVAIAPSSAAAQAPVRGAGDPAAIAGQYIVVLRAGAGEADKERAKNKARGKGGKVQRDYSAALNGFAARLSGEALAEVRADKDVKFVEVDRAVSLSTTQTGATWGLDRIDQRALPLDSAYSYTPTGAGVKAYIIDTGIRTSHTQFGGRAVSGFDSIDGLPADDCNGHGTHVAGTIGSTTYGVAKAVQLVAVRVLNCSGSGTNSGVIAGIDYVTANHAPGQPAVANMSLGGGASTALDTAVENSVADGVTYAVAAGNESTNACNRSPARTPSALTVGATTSSDARASYSNWGSCLDLFAPGSGITSTWSTSDSATNTISGTSMATPHVAGVAALYLEGDPSASPATVSSAIVNSATAGVVTSPRHGSPNRLLYSLLTAAPTPPPPATCGTAYTGSLSGTGASAIQPNGTYYQSTTSGTHKGCLTGPAGTDFDLYLYKWNGSSWSRVASAIGTTSTETINYSGTPGYYYWLVYAYSGGGSYTLEISRPA